MPLAASLDTVGPIAAGAEDARLAYGVLLGADVAAGTPSAAMRVGVVVDDLATTATPDVLEAIGAVAGWLDERARRVAPGLLDDYRPEDWEVLAWRELYEAHGGLLATPHLLGTPTRALLERGRDTSDEELEAARGRVSRLGARFLDALGDVDALLLPATPFPAPELDRREIRVGDRTLDVRRGAISVITRPVNLAGLPAVAFPVGFSAEGLPLGAQLVGPPEGEADLLGLVGAWQSETDFHLRMPPEPRGSA
jgi:aspartyl-tRNA(Asn)/glutamyl-tRNA(Gln) amidotransferase subunit A